jgi:hypothetical protein
LSSDRYEGCEHSSDDCEDVYKIVPYFAAVAGAGAVVEVRVGDDHHTTSALCPIYPGWEKSIAPWHNTGTRGGKPGNIRGWSVVQRVFPD